MRHGVLATGTIAGFLVLLAAAQAAEPNPARVTVDFAQDAGKIRALHGVNNGPVNWNLGADLTNYHKAAGFPSARLHDTLYGGMEAVDIHTIFPIFDADAEDPKYYTFAKTDAYLSGLVDNDTAITYRLGESIECRSRGYYEGGLFVHPPKDFAKWAKICVNIVRHYNEGWANGFHHDIKRWEIWNEPGENIAGMWPGTIEQYCQLYETTARALKAHDPSLQVGGPAVCDINFPLGRTFLAFCRDRQVPLDFFTWHCYTADPEQMAGRTRVARKLIDEFGFTKAESQITEWHPMWYPWEGSIDCNERGNPDPQKYATMREKFDTMRGPKGAAYVAATLLLLQDCPVDMANYYTADTNPWGMFDHYGVPGRVYYAFLAFQQLTTTPHRVACWSPEGTGVVACAGLSDDRRRASILLSNFGAARTVELSLEHLALAQPVEAESLAVDADHEFMAIANTTVKAENATLSLDLPENAVYLVRLHSAGP